MAIPTQSVATEADSAAADAFTRLRGDILAGVLAPGSRLRFADLQTRYGIGTSPLREALSRLNADRLVVQEVNRGFSVPPLSPADFHDIAALRLDLEVKALRASVAAGDEAWEEGVVLAHHRLKRLGTLESSPVEAGVDREWETRHRAFHTALIAACGSPMTLHFCGLLNDQFDRYRRVVGRDAKVQLRLARQHADLVDAAMDRKADEAAAILATHITETTAAVARRLERPA